MANTSNFYLPGGIILIFILLTACTDSQQTTDKYIQRGKSHISTNQYEKARVELKNAAQIDPKNADIYAYMGLIEESRNEPERAIQNYRKSIELGTTLAIPHTKLSFLYLALAETEKKLHNNKQNEFIKQAENHLESALKAKSNDQDSLILKALIKDYYGDTSESLTILYDLYNKDKSAVNITRILVKTLEKSGKIEEAENILLTNISNHKKSTAYQIELADHYDRTSKIENSIKVLKSILTTEPELYQLRIRLANELIKNQNKADAINLIKQGFDINRNDEQAILQLSEKLATFNRHADAIKELKNSPLYNESEQIRLKIARLKIEQKLIDSAIKELEEVTTKWQQSPSAITAHQLLVEIFLSVGNTEKADYHIQKILTYDSGDYNGLLLNGKMNLFAKNYTDAINNFRSILKSNPDDIDLKLILANSYKYNNQPDLYENEIKSIKDLIKNNPDQLIKIPQLYIKNREYVKAMAEINNILDHAPENLAALILKSEVYFYMSDIDNALHTLNTVNRLYPENPVGWFRKSRIYKSQNRISEAIDNLETAYRKDPTSDDLLAELTDLESANGLKEKSINRLESLIKENSRHRSAHKFLGINYLQSGDIEVAKRHLETHNQINPYDSTIYSHLAGIYETEGQNQKSLEFYQKDLEQRPANIPSILSTASLLEKTGHINDAMSLYERALTIDKNNIIAANNLTVLLINKHAGESALKRANELLDILKQQSQLAPVQDTIGWIHYKSGRYQQASNYLEKAIKQAPTMPTFNYHFGMNQIKLGNTDIAIKHLKIASRHGTGNDKINADKVLASLLPVTSSSAD